MKRCSKCKKEKPLDAFGCCRSASDGLFSWCKTCKHEGDRITRIKRFEKDPDHRLWEQRKRLYKMTKADWLALLVAQEGMCMCGAVPTEVDHDHACCVGPATCGECVRGLLCHRCNLLDVLDKDSAYVLGVPKIGANNPRRKQVA